MRVVGGHSVLQLDLVKQRKHWQNIYTTSRRS